MTVFHLDVGCQVEKSSWEETLLAFSVFLMGQCHGPFLLKKFFFKKCRFSISCSEFPNFSDLGWPFLRTCFETHMFLGIIEMTPLSPLYFLSILQTLHIHFIPLQLTPQGPSLYLGSHPSSLHLPFPENPTPGPFNTCLLCE